MRCMSLLPEMLAEPIICRTYQSPRVSPSIISSVKVSAPSGKWPQKITAWAQTLRIALAVSVPSSAGSNGAGQRGDGRRGDVVLGELASPPCGPWP